MSTHFPNARRDLDKADDLAQRLIDAAVELGAKNAGMNYDNALSFLTKLGRQLKQLEERTSAAGYSSLAVAVKAIAQTKTKSKLMPLEMMYAPEHWVKEASLVKVSDKFGNRQKVFKEGKVTAATAQGRRNGLQKLIDELFFLIEKSGWSEYSKGCYISDITKCYQNDTYEEFTFALLTALQYLVEDGTEPDYSPEGIAAAMAEEEKEEKRQQEERIRKEEEQLAQALELTKPSSNMTYTPGDDMDVDPWENDEE